MEVYIETNSVPESFNLGALWHLYHGLLEKMLLDTHMYTVHVYTCMCWRDERKKSDFFLIRYIDFFKIRLDYVLAIMAVLPYKI